MHSIGKSHPPFLRTKVVNTTTYHTIVNGNHDVRHLRNFTRANDRILVVPKCLFVWHTFMY